jgi:hypothetical protein
MPAGVGIVGRECRAGVAVDDDGGECRAVTFPRLTMLMVGRILAVPVAARFGGIVGENNRRGDGDQPENANPQNTRGSQGCSKHRLPRPNFCLDHRFVRPNYAQLPVAFPCSGGSIRIHISGPGADRTDVLANRLYPNKFSDVCGPRTSSQMRLGGLSFQKIKQPLRQLRVFAPKLDHFVHRTNILDFIVHRTTSGRLGTRDFPADQFSHQSGNPADRLPGHRQRLRRLHQEVV